MGENTSVRNWWWLVVRGLLFIAASIITFSKPGEALLGLTIYLGAILLATGVSEVIMSISARKTVDNWGWYLLEGLFDGIIGYFILTRAIPVSELIPLTIGFWGLFAGVLGMVHAFRLKEMDVKYWWLPLVNGVIIGFIGFRLLGNPVASYITTATLISIAFFMAGLLNIAFGFTLRKA